MGMIEARAGDPGTARRYLERAIDAAGSDRTTAAEAWYWISVLTADTAGKRAALEEVLVRDPAHARARIALAILDGKVDPKEIVDPDALPPQPAGPVEAEARRFVCPNCGARMVFAPDGQSLACEHCGYSETPGAGPAAEEQDFLAAMATRRGHLSPAAQQVFHCQGCGAEFLLPPTLISSTCLYCGSPHIVSLQGSREWITPEAVLPHAFDAKQAATNLLQWLMGSGNAAETKTEPFRGLYVPAWTFDLGGEVRYTGQMARSEQRQGEAVPGLRVVEDGYPIHVDDLVVPAGRSLAAPLTRLLPTFNLSQLLPYDPRYLADWPAEVYDISMADASLEARARAFQRLRRELPAFISPLQVLSASSAGITVESFKLILLPVWLTRLPRKGREEIVLMNGHNGAVVVSGPEKKGLWDWLTRTLQE
jgi:DNA-directed RNA polymerase subunit RPC12/RpoP